MKTYRELYNTVREILIDAVGKAKANYQGTPEGLKDWVWQDLEPAIEEVIPEEMNGRHILTVLGQKPDLMSTRADLLNDHGTVQEFLVDLLRNALYSDIEPEAKTIIDAAVEARRKQRVSPTP